ncbi:MAG TPA: CBS domain-containing protein [Longimicrobiales bacterium]|nr:CBS domain-containing protein [Longimicrobiales bacterium]
MSEGLRVDDALEPVIYKVRPETTLGEILNTMVGNRVGAVPVVGERSEVLGIITSGDVLDQLLRDSPTDDSPPAVDRLTARDIMTRTVLCVAEGQALKDAARMMVNKGIEQLPVVREGELIGIVTRSKVLRALHGSRKKTEES